MTISIAQILAEQEAERLAAGETANKHRLELLQKFMEKGISKVRVEFAGSGDSGSIEDITIECADGEDRSEEFSKNYDGSEVGKFQNGGLYKEVEEWSYTYISSCGVDWYNNDGGQGHIEFDMTSVPFKFACSIDVNETVSSNAFFTEEVA